jgi:aspartokinase
LGSFSEHLQIKPKKNKKSNTNKKIQQVVMKFGGSSLENANRIEYITQLIKNQITIKNCFPRAIVCSAMGQTTNMLLHAGQQALHGTYGYI